jgi:hypothetical protein
LKGVETMPETSQAIVHIVRGGGCQTIKRICSQWEYLSRKGELELQFSERHGAGVLPYEEFEIWARRWAEQTGKYIDGVRLSDGHQELTTHIIVSFPHGTDEGAAHAAGRDWAESMFGSGQNGGEWDYVTAFHTDKPHPHLHVVVNRRALSARSEWLAISHRNRFLNYDTLREGLADVAYDYGIELDTSSRAQRGLEGRNPTRAQYRQWARIEIQSHTEADAETIDLATDGYVESFPELTGIDPTTGMEIDRTVSSAEAEIARRNQMVEHRRQREQALHQQEDLPHPPRNGEGIETLARSEHRETFSNHRLQLESDPMELDDSTDHAIAGPSYRQQTNVAGSEPSDIGFAGETVGGVDPMDVDFDAGPAAASQVQAGNEAGPVDFGETAEQHLLDEHEQHLRQTARDRRRPVPRSIIQTRGQKIRMLAEQKRLRKERRNQRDPDRIIETRVQKRARLKAEAEARRGEATSTHPMTLRNTRPVSLANQTTHQGELQTLPLATNDLTQADASNAHDRSAVGRLDSAGATAAGQGNGVEQVSRKNNGGRGRSRGRAR